MLLRVVIALQRLSNTIIIRITAGSGISNYVAIVVIRHISSHISLVMVKILRRRTMETGWVMIPIPRRTPWLIIARGEIGVDDWGGVISRLHNIVRSVNIWCTYYLNVRRLNSRNFGNNGSHILEHIRSQDSLNEKDMGIAIGCF